MIWLQVVDHVRPWVSVHANLWLRHGGLLSPGRFVLSLLQKIKDNSAKRICWMTGVWLLAASNLLMKSIIFPTSSGHKLRIIEVWSRYYSMFRSTFRPVAPQRGFGLTRWPTWSWESPRRWKLRGFFPRGDPQSLWVFNIEMVMPWLGWFGGTPISMKPLDLTCLILV